MLKKAIPLIMMSGLVLGACNMNGANGNKTVPNNNETPMQGQKWTPNVNNGTGGTNLDGIDNGRDLNGNGVRNGVINGNPNVTPNVPSTGAINNGTTTTPGNGVIIEKDTVIEENRNGTVR